MLSEKPLSAFLHLAETSSFQQAAKRTGVSNASLSRYISLAEEQVGFVLFDRRRGNSTLTRKGRAYLPVAKKLYSDLIACADQTNRIRLETDQVVHVGCGPLTPRTLIQPALSAAQMAYPGLRARIDVSARQTPIEMLENGEIDIYVGDLTHTPETENIELMMFEKRAVMFAAHISHPLHKMDNPSLKDLFSHPFASPHLHKHWRAVIAQALGGTPEAAEKVATMPTIESDDYAFLTTLLTEDGFVVGGMPETFAEAVATGEVALIEPHPRIQWNICAARRAGDTHSAAQVFWQKLQSLTD
ncbi:transcriptional regulator, LysR family [Ruegeria halocynthiae]|uniref:Transcriptional regulator, LysR family n=1 Tax=Ruegeria halocynthiae TaxID=985054 RepID=A0A1H3ALR8_9RHOB|nr:LysR family transcriptional regulator [Ruegeria halocynthiae]SDX30670.1 transcriptional regulator, LysR family [Ruegeria halocynthiae]